jgi:hypothetical protein
LAGTLLFDEKIRQSASLFWFGLRDAGILYSRVVILRTNDVSPAFLERKRSRFEHMQTMIQTKWDEAAQNFELLLNIQDQKSKIKNL